MNVNVIQDTTTTTHHLVSRGSARTVLLYNEHKMDTQPSGEPDIVIGLCTRTIEVLIAR